VPEFACESSRFISYKVGCVSMKNKDIESLYTRKGKFYHSLMGFFRYDKGLNAFFQRSNYFHSNMKILDAGCGSGLSTRSMYAKVNAQRLSNVVFHGFDLTKNMLDLFEHWINLKGIANIHLAQADILTPNNLPKHWKDYDLIVSSAMLEYIPKTQLQKALQNLGKRLRKNGKMVVFITKKNIIMEYLIHRWWKANIYSKKEIKQLASQMINMKLILTKVLQL